MVKGRGHRSRPLCVRGLPLAAALVGGLVLAGCAETELAIHTAKRVNAEQAEAGTYKVGNPYKIAGVWYYPKVDYDYVETGIASWYGDPFHGRKTANGESYDMNALTAAHRTLPLPSIVRVTNLENGRAITVRVNDRGPFAHGRIIDMSRRGAQLLGFVRNGTAKVRVEILAEESRMAAAVAQGGTEVASLPAAPRGTVRAESLPPPGTTGVSGVQETAAPPRQVASAEPLEKAADAQVTVEPVAPTAMYVQVGAFLDFANANRLRASLSALGPTRVSTAEVDGRKFFRVRVGPIAQLDQADQLLERVIGAGHDSARLIVE